MDSTAPTQFAAMSVREQGATAAPLPPEATTVPSFEVLYRAHFKDVWRFLHRLGARGGWVDDLTHDVFLTAFKKFQEFDSSRSAKAWLQGIAWRIAADHRRLHVNTTQSALSPEEAIHARGVSASAAQPDQQLLARQAAEILDETLLELVPLQRAVFVMHELEGLTVPEIARAMDASVPTSYSRLRLARENFAEALARVRKRRGVT